MTPDGLFCCKTKHISECEGSPCIVQCSCCQRSHYRSRAWCRSFTERRWRWQIFRPVLSALLGVAWCDMRRKKLRRNPTFHGGTNKKIGDCPWAVPGTGEKKPQLYGLLIPTASPRTFSAVMMIFMNQSLYSGFGSGKRGTIKSYGTLFSDKAGSIACLF